MFWGGGRMGPVFWSKGRWQESEKPDLERSVTGTGHSPLPCVLSLVRPHSSYLVHGVSWLWGSSC